jgi:hypothetical protein
MKKNLKRKIALIIVLLSIGFTLLFTFRLMYGYEKVIEDSVSFDNYFEYNSSEKKNYASKEYSYKGESSQQTSATVDQKYEKIANINTTTNSFDEDEKLVRSKTDDFEAIIQYEQKSGNSGYRKLHMMIGVPPENFDTLYTCLIKIGHVQTKQISKKDKTNEYKELNARKTSLEKTLNSLIDLKTKSGKIEEFIELENRILSIEEQLQNLGVKLGDFDGQNEFCTVQFSLYEKSTTIISLKHRVKVALEWTVKVYLKIIINIALFFVIAYFFLWTIDKLKLLHALARGLELMKKHKEKKNQKPD